MRRHDPLVDPAPLIRRVYSYVAYRVGEGPEAEDITSEAFERALRYRETYDARRGAPLQWLIGIARRCIADRRVIPGLDADVVDAAAPGDLEARALERLTVFAAVKKLPERDRELLALRYGADLSARQIAELVDMKTNAVEVALHRALARVRLELEAGAAPGGEAARVSDPAPKPSP